MSTLLLIVIIILIIIAFNKISQLNKRIRSLETKGRDALIAAPSSVDKKEPSSRSTQHLQSDKLPKAKHTQTVATESPVSTFYSDTFKRAIAWISSVNSIVLLGGFLLFLGLAFLFNFVAQHHIVSLQFRLMTAACIAVIILFFGWRLRHTKRTYALSLQGIAIAIWYLLTVSSCYHFHVINFSIGLILLACLSIMSCVLALVQDSKVLVISSILGGFFSPLIIYAPFMSGASFLSFYLLLNLVIFTISWFKSWRGLNWIGFIFTFVLSSFWYHQYYQPNLFTVIEVFLILFYIIYLAVPVIYAVKQPPNLKGYVDGTLIFAMPIIIFSLQGVIVSYDKTWLMCSAIIMGATYLLFSAAIRMLASNKLKLLSQTHLFLGLLFVTVAIPLAVTGDWSTVIWAVEGVGLVWVGVRQHRLVPIITGCLLQIASSLHFIVILKSFAHAMSALDLVNFSVFALTAYVSSYFLYQEMKKRKYLENIAYLLFAMGCAWLFSDIFHGIILLVPVAYHSMAWLILISCVAIIVCLVDYLIEWSWIMLLRYVLTVLMPLIFISSLLHAQWYSGIIYAWIFAFIVQYAILYYVNLRKNSPQPKTHTLLIWLMLCVLSYYVYLLCLQFNLGLDWRVSSYGVLAAAMLYVLTFAGHYKHCWPFSACPAHYLTTVMKPLIILSAAGILYVSCVVVADYQPMHYLPILNPPDITTIILLAALICAAKCWGEASGEKIHKSIFYGAFIGIVFIWLNSVIIQTMHAWYHVAYEWSSILNSGPTQLTLTTFYIIFALITMIVATAKKWRNIWFIGYGLIILTMFKLFLIDLANINTIERIITFIFTGFILMLLGYVSPLPPKQKATC